MSFAGPCGRTADVDCAVGHRPCLQAAEDHGFIIDEAEVVYWGYCPACQQGVTAAGPEKWQDQTMNRKGAP